jgi:hypothetical protein
MTNPSGYYLMHRGWMDHPVLRADRAPANRREAWIWLIEHAAFQAYQASAGKARVTLARGQQAHALRYMAKAWGWDDAKVRRFLGALRADGMIDAIGNAHFTVIGAKPWAGFGIRRADRGIGRGGVTAG